MFGTASWQTKAVLILGMIGAVTALVLSKGSAGSTALRGGEVSSARLISVAPLPASEGELCEWVPASANPRLAAALQQGLSSPPSTGAAPAKRPLRVIHDPSPGFTGVAVDPVRNEVVFSDENLHGVKVYDRLANTPPTAAFTEPKRSIAGTKTRMEFQCGVYIDPGSGDIYSIDNDVHNNLVVFSRQAQGNVPPNRYLNTPHGTFGLAVDEDAQELFTTVEHDNALVVYKKMAKEDDAPVRLLQGNKTGLADPHGIALDPKNRLMFIINHGSVHEKVPGGKRTTAGGPPTPSPRPPTWPVGDGILGSGKNLPPSIIVHSMDAQGDSPPLRKIQGANARLNWPMGIAFDPKRDEIFVANDTGQEVLVFSATASGNAAPVRVIKGPKSLIKNPTGVFVDTQNDELWVANFGNHSATVYKPTAEGDAPPLRVIRAAPVDQQAPIIGNPGSVAYDSKRDELLVPN